MSADLAASWSASGGAQSDAVQAAIDALLPPTDDWILFPPDKVFLVAEGSLFQVALTDAGVGVDRWVLGDGRTHIGVLDAPPNRTWRFVRRGGHDVELTVVSVAGEDSREERFARAVARAAGWPLP
jgi:hypothetical protein